MGDVTTRALISEPRKVHVQIRVKSRAGIISGLSVVRKVFAVADPSIVFAPHIRDGDCVRRGDVAATVHGSAHSILRAERVALELLRRMSGIATKTHTFVEAVKDTGVTILDTRKTLPGYGELDKQAVRDGGGVNHRLNLSSMGLIKNNHIDMLGGNITHAIRTFRHAYPDIPLEVEVRNISEFTLALDGMPDSILLDNMTMVNIRQAVTIRNNATLQTGKAIPLEASGNMTLARVRAVSKTGVEYISIGALTHSVQALDISMHVMKV